MASLNPSASGSTAQSFYSSRAVKRNLVDSENKQPLITILNSKNIRDFH